MTDGRLAAIVAALSADQRDGYDGLVREFLRVEEAEVLWRVLGAAHGSEFDLIERLLGWSTSGVRNVLRRLLPAVGHLPTLSLPDAIRFLWFAERVEPSFRHLVSEQLRPHIGSVPELGSQLGEALRLGEVSGEGARRVWAASFASGAPQQAAQYALDLLPEPISGAGLLALLLQFLPLKDPPVLSLLEPQEGRLVAVLDCAASDVGRDAWFAMTAIADFSPSAMNALQRAVTEGDVRALSAAASWMYGVNTPMLGATGIRLDEFVMQLLRHAVAKDEVRGWVDSGVASLLHRSSLRALILPCIAELGVVDTNVAELFDQTFDGVCEQPQDFTQLLTTWLLREDVTFTAIRGALARCAAQRAPAGLDSANFAAAPLERKVAAARRLLALTNNGPLLCQFIASLAETPTMQPEGLILAAQMLNEAFSEYPSATVEFLEPRTRPVARHTPHARTYRGVYANALRWRRILERLPQLNELRATDAQLHALRSMRNRVNRDILRAAAERSILAAMGTSIHVAQGRRFATHTAHGAPQVVEMQEASHSIELPSSELADPVGGMLRRAMALRDAR